MRLSIIRLVFVVVVVVVVPANAERVPTSSSTFTSLVCSAIFTSFALLSAGFLFFFPAAEELDVGLFRGDDAVRVLVDFHGLETDEFHAFDDASNTTATGDVGGRVSRVVVDATGRFEDAEEFGVEFFAVQFAG